MNVSLACFVTMFQIHIVGIGHIVMTSVRLALTTRGPCNTP